VMYMEKEVFSGIVFLDLTQPGWRDRVNWDKLNMYDPYMCVAGQVYGNYNRAMSSGKFGYISRDGDPWSLGFDIHRGGLRCPCGNWDCSDWDSDGETLRFEQLQATWKVLGQA